MTEKVTVIGAGLAGSEAAWQLAKRGIKVDPVSYTHLTLPTTERV